MPLTSWIDVLDRQDSGREIPASAEALLLGFPVRLGHRDAERMRVLFAELTEVAENNALVEARMRVPRRLLELAGHLVAEFGEAIELANKRRDEAFAAGEETLDLRYPLDSGSRRLLIDYARVMEQVDVYCRAGTLRSAATPVDCYALRRWIVEEFVRQYDGQPPRPWDGPTG